MRVPWTKGFSRKEKLAFIWGTALPFQGDDCLPWPFRKNNAGYGVFSTATCAHRYICQIMHGSPVFLDMDAAHGCGRRDCVNPRHLSWKTRKANQRDQIKHGTLLHGERHPNAKLSEAQIAEIREACRDPERPLQRELAVRYGVTQKHISDIMLGKRRLGVPRMAT